jgi:hypothetical protein
MMNMNINLHEAVISSDNYSNPFIWFHRYNFDPHNTGGALPQNVISATFSGST